MNGYIRKIITIGVISLALGLFVHQNTYAASLSNASDTLSTSRPSAAAPLATAQAANAGQVTVIDLPTNLNNSALWLASDSAVLLPDTGQTLSTVGVASMSASNTPSSNQRVVYFTGQVSSTHHAGTTMITPVTATHTIQFTPTASNIPASGHIIITFPGAGSNIASPSATGFSFNGMTTSNPTDVKFNNATCSSVTVTGSNTIDCVLSSQVTTNTVVTVIIGCSAQSGGVCTTFAPRLINPIKSSQAAGSADQWKITIKTQDNNGVDLDSANIIAGTVESVQVQGTVEPYMTMTISGIANGGSACSDTTNPGVGLNATATFVNLGSLSSGQRNISAQNIQIDTNGSFGYSLTATSSGHFVNPGTGIFLPDANDQGGSAGLAGNSSTNGTNPSPVAITAGTPAFGIHACANGSSVTTPTIPTGWGTGGGASNKFANPWNTGTNGYYAKLASTTGPSATSITTVEYAATVSSTTPAGVYTAVFTYVGTPSF